MRRSRVVVMLAVSACAPVGLLMACSSPSPGSDTIGTVGVVTEPTLTTLLPIVVDTASDITLTVPPKVLFAGDLCSALSVDDIARAGVGTVVDFGALSPDSCGWTVQSGRKYGEVIVRARTPDEYTAPAAPTGATISAIRGVGLGAFGFEQIGRTYVVFVQVDNGYFSVEAPDETGAVGLAKIAVGRAAG